MKETVRPAQQPHLLSSTCPLEQLGCLADKEIDRLMRLAQRLFQVPLVLVSLTETNEHRYKSSLNFDLNELINDLSEFAYSLLAEDLIYISDVSRDLPWADNKLVTGKPNIRFYAGTPLATADGERIGLFCIISDRVRELTAEENDTLRDLADGVAAELERMQLLSAAERRLKSYEAQTAALVDTVLDGIITINAQELILTFNRAAETIFGYSREEILGQNINKLLPQRLADAREEFLRRHFAVDAKTSLKAGNEAYGKRKDGSTFPMLLGLSEIAADDERIIISVHDITEIKMMELAFKRYEAIIRYSNDAIISKNLDGIITSWNEGAENLFGYTAIEMIGRPMLVLYPPGKNSEEQAILKKLLRGEKVQHFESLRRRKNGSLIDIAITISPIINDAGDVIGVSNIARDITERKRLERMKSEFISTVSHELRTPLTSIRGALDLVLGKSAAQLPDKAQKMLTMAARNSARLTLLINDILDLEKIESKRIEFEFALIDLVSLAHRALDDNEGYAHKHRVQLILASDELVAAPVYGDEHRLLQVFANLISNAVKFSPAGDKVAIAVAAHQGAYRVTVVDHGPGIPEEFRQRIFQRFAQADGSDTREKGGTGLGLSISKAIIERHGGTIGYDSIPGQGAQFYFNLPAVPATHPNTDDDTGGARVLICEDNLDLATILAEMVKQEDVVCDIAATAAAARSMLAKHDYRLLLLDLTLPDADGLQLIQELRDDRATRQLPIIVVSGRAMEGRMALNGNALTVADWLQKPVDLERLTNAIHPILQRSEKARILHVEDNADVIQIVQTLLEGACELSYATHLAEARVLLAEHRFDLVILDLGLADGSGIELLDELDCPVVIFSAQTIDRKTSERVHATLTKSMTSNSQLLATIKKILSKSI